MSTYSHRIEGVRAQMINAEIDVLIVPGSDSHLSEYLAEHWKTRDWLSGFTGSAGTLVVTRTQAGLWTDSRYYLQAEDQLKNSGIDLYKEGLPGVPDPIKWITSQFSSGARIALNGTCFSKSRVKEITQQLQQKQIVLETQLTLAEDVWTDRPSIPMDPILLHPQDLAGLSCQEKIEMVRAQLRKTGATHYVVNTLDEIAWATNTRGSDIPFNPVYHAFMVIGPEKTALFTYTQKLTAPIREYFSAQDIDIHPYDNIYFFLTGLNSHDTVFLDPERTNFALTSALSTKVKIKEGAGIITLLKGVKNDVEIRHIRETMRLDGIAMVRFLKWLEESVPKGNVTELTAAQKLKEFRSESDRFVGESFNTISGYGAHGAIVHYSVTPRSDIPLRNEGIYLLDSGGQYVTGTTDLTRTIALGPVPEQAKTDFTLVLKGHIALARVTFPKGTRGVHLDILARQFLWEHQLNYGHGTGHGVGYFLNVHEGPQSIRPQDNGIEIEPGMITSNEPGLYRSGQYGIRTENLVVTKEISENEFGTFLAFETVTLCPIDLSLIKVELLSPSEKEWLNQYHQRVYAQLKPALGKEEVEWLKAKTAAI